MFVKDDEGVCEGAELVIVDACLVGDAGWSTAESVTEEEVKGIVCV